MIKDDYIKEKGMFITKVLLGKGMSAKIIPEAIRDYFVDGIPVKDTIYNCKDIKKFLTYQKQIRNSLQNIMENQYKELIGSMHLLMVPIYINVNSKQRC